MKYRLLVLLFLFSQAANAQLPRVFILNASRMAELKLKAATRDKTIADYLDSLKKEADHFLDMNPVSVMDKEITPPSGNKHDYMSQAPYFWYDSSKPKGLPYLRRDGVRNPEINKITDHVTMDKMLESTRMLSLAWYLLGDKKYADKCASLIRTCFLDKATKMNPNLDYGQGIPGINTGRGIGIIETRSLMYIADAVGLIANSKSWSNGDQRALQQWYADYLKWLLTSKNGKEEHAAKNNHGTWYYAQVIDFALFSGDKTKALQLVNESKKRLDSQITNEGKQPLELERTNALGYSTMNIDGWFTVAKLAKHVGVDLWHYKAPATEAGIWNAVEWLAPFGMGAKKFEYQQINPYNKAELYPILLEANAVYNDHLIQHYLISFTNNERSWLANMMFGVLPPNAREKTIRVLSYNIHHANPPARQAR